MNAAAFWLRKRTVVVCLSAALAIAGLCGYLGIAKFGNSEFVVRSAQIVTSYPGASAEEVAERVTDPVEAAVQRIAHVRRVTSTSYRGRSIVVVDLTDDVDERSMPQVLDELRRKVEDVRERLPHGCGEPMVNDDYGDVYGLMYAISGDGFSMAELKEYAKMLSRELMPCEDVAKIDLLGDQEQILLIEISRAKIASLGITPGMISSALSGHTVPVDAGNLRVGEKYIRFHLVSNMKSIDALEDVLIADGVYLGDVCTYRFDYADPPSVVVRRNGKPCIVLGVSKMKGGNAIRMEQAVERRVRELLPVTPIGIETEVVSRQCAGAISAADVVSLVRDKWRGVSCSSRLQFLVHVWMPEGTFIAKTDEQVSRLAESVRRFDGVIGISSFVGRGALRFVPTYTPEDPNPAYGMLLVDVADADSIPSLMRMVESAAPSLAPDAEVHCQRFAFNPDELYGIQVRILGNGLSRLRSLGEEVLSIFRSDGCFKDVHSDWRNRVDLIEPVVSEERISRLGLTRSDVARAFRLATDGVSVGEYQLGDETLPIVLRAKDDERNTISGITAAWVWSPNRNVSVPLAQVVDQERQTSEESRIKRQNRIPCLTVKCNVREGESVAEAFSRIRPALDKFAARLPAGYRVEYVGE